MRRQSLGVEDGAHFVQQDVDERPLVMHSLRLPEDKRVLVERVHLDRRVVIAPPSRRPMDPADVHRAVDGAAGEVDDVAHSRRSALTGQMSTAACRVLTVDRDLSVVLHRGEVPVDRENAASAAVDICVEGASPAMSDVINFSAAPSTPIECTWIHGSPARRRGDDPPIQVHAFDEHTYVLRQSKA